MVQQLIYSLKVGTVSQLETIDIDINLLVRR